MHVNLSFNCARPSFKTSLKDYMNWFTLRNCSIKVQKIKCIDHQHFVDYALYSILKLTVNFGLELELAFSSLAHLKKRTFH
jgi:hypothetical protein